MRLSGLVLDFYDDQGDASTFKSIYPERGDVPLLVKTAHVLTSEEHARLPDDVFALVLMQDDGVALRKYACIDPGNTVLSVEYFLANRDKLPVEAQKLAAANLTEACRWYSLQPPAELVKVALGVADIGMGALNAYTGAQVAKAGAKKFWGDVAGSKGVVNPHIKIAETSNTSLMPGQESVDKTPPGTTKAVVKKTAGLGRLVQGKVKHPQSESGEPPEVAGPVPGHQAQAHQHKQLQPHINVQGAEPPSPTKMKVSHVTALRGKYPLDSYEQVKAASAYFEENWMHFSPEDRREYCVSMVKRADAMGIPVSDMARKYGSATYAPQDEIDFALSARRSLYPEEGVALLDKLAQVRAVVEPEVFALALYEMDKTAGVHHFYDRDLLDPFFTTFGFVKEATYSESIGNDYINEFMLQQVAQSHYAWIKERFGEDMADEFRKDPVGIFKSLPMEQKKIIMRLAADVQPSSGES